MAGSAAQRPGGRTARIRRQVLDAVAAELLDHGFSALTVDTVATRAEVHRATVFRRWRDVGGLLSDTIDAAQHDDWAPPDRGSLLDDLTALNSEIVEHLGADRSLSSALIGAASSSPTAAAALRRFLEDRYRRCEIVVARAVDRGELPADTAARELLVSSTGPVYHLVLHLGVHPDDAACAAWAYRAITGHLHAHSARLPTDPQPTGHER